MLNSIPCNLPSHQDGRVVKALDLRSNGHMSAWVRTPLLVECYFATFTQIFRSNESTRSPPTNQKFSIFMHIQFSGKISEIVYWRPCQGLAPPLGNPESATVMGWTQKRVVGSWTRNTTVLKTKLHAPPPPPPRWLSPTKSFLSLNWRKLHRRAEWGNSLCVVRSAIKLGCCRKHLVKKDKSSEWIIWGTIN